MKHWRSLVSFVAWGSSVTIGAPVAAQEQPETPAAPPAQSETTAAPDVETPHAEALDAAAASAEVDSADVDSADVDSGSESSPQLVTPRTPLANAPAARLSRQESASYGPAEKGSSRIVLPSQWAELGGEMVFLTSQPALMEQATRFTDVGLLNLRARRSFTDRVEGYVYTQLLAKQPSSTDEALWQAAGLGLRAELLDGFAAALGGGTGLMLNDAGWWWQAAPTLMFKPEISRYLRFLVSAGGAFSMLHFDEPVDEAFWFSEITADAEVQAGDDSSAMWVGLNYAVPVASNPDASRPDPVRGFLDPQVRLGLNVGGSLSLNRDDWDVYAVFSVIDRGDLEAPETTLPILDGGYDQQQIMIGVQHRFGPSGARDRMHQGYW